MDADYKEVNFDGLVSPVHNYGGLSVDNLASGSNRLMISHPKLAALQGLKKMKTLVGMGLSQGVIPPPERPSLQALKSFGIQGVDSGEIFLHASINHPSLFAACSSASSMWTANAATVAPSCDTGDGRLCMVVANLSSKLHRAIEADETYRMLEKIFGDAVVPAIPGGQAMSDEGAANHTRLSPSYGEKALHVFVYGRSGEADGSVMQRFLGRQTRLASEAVARHFGLQAGQAVFIRQNQAVIDAGVFHNDVIAVGNLNCYFSHENAYENGEQARQMLSDRYAAFTGHILQHVVVPETAVPVTEVITSYLFNSQLIGASDSMTLVAPTECQNNPRVKKYLEQLVKDSENPINEVLFFNLKESMRNGGGPACLRLRVVMNNEEIASLGARVMLTDGLYNDLVSWVNRHYRDDLHPDDLGDPGLRDEICAALDELSGIMELGSIYPFQQ